MGSITSSLHHDRNHGFDAPTYAMHFH